MFYTVYKITNTVNNKFYIGKHQTKNLADGYMGSGKILKFAIAKYGIENFTKEILHIFDNEADMNAKEKELVIVNEDTYNLNEGGRGGFGYINSNNLRFDINSYLTKNNARVLGFKGKRHTLESKIKISTSRLNNPHDGFSGKFHSEDTKIHLSMVHMGKHTGYKNSQYGTCWITTDTENKKIKNDDLSQWMQLGYKKGRRLIK